MKINSEKIIFISWTSGGKHTELLAKSLNAKLFFIDKFISGNSKNIIIVAIDYLIKILRTMLIIIITHPKVIFVQNPPTIAPVVVVLLSKLFKFKTIIDTHNGAFEKPWIGLPLHKWALNNASIVTIHNEVLLNDLIKNKAFKSVNFYVLNSRISEFSPSLKTSISKEYFLIVSSFASDEPMMKLLEGISDFLKLSDKFLFKVTGNYNRQPQVYSNFRKIRGIEFLGFISDSDYQKILVNAYGVISVSSRNTVQQFSLMEAIGAGIPFISNRNLTNVDLYKDKMILIEIDKQSIVNGILEFISRKDELDRNIVLLKNDLMGKWKSDFHKLLEEIGYAE